MKELGCQAILFDLDGVLVDSTACIERHWRNWAEKNNLDLGAILRVSTGRRTEDTIRLVAPHLEVEEEAARIAEQEAVDTDGVLEIEGAARLLRMLPAGAWAVVTSGPTKSSLARLARAGLPVPTVVVTAEDVKRGKPDPEPYLVAAVRLGVAPAECVVVEDAPAGIQSAHAAGMRVIAVASTHPVDELSAEAVANRLADIHVMASENRSADCLTVRVEAPFVMKA
jgi:mannitol-1-/sugar-/sorbitol-6-phosphatase